MTDLDRQTTGALMLAHVERIVDQNDPGEIELVMGLFHFLHARRYVNDPDVALTRYKDFVEQLDMVVKSV